MVMWIGGGGGGEGKRFRSKTLNAQEKICITIGKVGLNSLFPK